MPGKPGEGYDYGPPVEQTGETNTPAETHGDELTDEGETPHTPPENTDTITVPGGSPSEEAVEGADPDIVSLDPATAVVGDDVEVTVAGNNFSENSVVEVGQAEVSTTYESATSLTATFVDPGEAGTVSVTVRNPTSEQESNSVEFTWAEPEEET